MELLPRRFVVEQYVRYDAPKKKKQVPVFNDWDWSNANAIDARLIADGYKHGVIAGYLFWKAVELNQSDLACCAIDNAIFPDLPRSLGELCGYEKFKTWEPNGKPEWHEPLERGEAYKREWPLLLRPSVSCESPAKWYLEDGSGRGICLFRQLLRFNDSGRKAFGYLGVTPDQESAFMKENFRALLNL